MFSKVFVVRVHLADNEWGNELMKQVAQEIILSIRKLVTPLVVYVYEHAGWALGYTMIDGELKVCYSANDAARYSEKVEAFRQAAYNAEWVTLDEFHRS
jgi:hypothetical protein